MNIQQIQDKHLEAIENSYKMENLEKENDILASKECTKITLQAIVDKLTEINNNNKHQKYSDGYNSNIENEIEIITKQIKQL